MSFYVLLATKVSKPAEYIGLAGTLVGLVLKVLHLDAADEMLMIGMSILSMAYFLRAYMPIQLREGEGSGSMDLLGATLLPKVSMIACAVIISGSLFEILHLHGGGDMLLIGCTALAASTALAIICLLKDRERYAFLGGYLLRMIPIGLLGFYLFPNLPA